MSFVSQVIRNVKKIKGPYNTFYITSLVKPKRVTLIVDFVDYPFKQIGLTLYKIWPYIWPYIKFDLI